ncbi:MAG: UDP-3-O-acyl-N-acetylglucosamine deacetylase [Rhodospirillaceae bacterium]|nr:UDP-3-O-acyl-N-acetylglucosamine deacetylase [Rhodospirillaceae bacterium]
MTFDVSNPGTVASLFASSTETLALTLRQRTLKSSIGCMGVGLHTGARVGLKLHPAPANTGIVFKRVDLVGGGAEIPARWSSVVDSRMCTVIADSSGVSVATVEHLMSAFYGIGVDNALVEINGPEVPAMDGSAYPFVFLMECAGLVEQDAPRKALRILKPTSVANGAKRVTLAPAAAGLTVDFEIDFKAAAIGRQTCSVTLDGDTFKLDVARSRTFGLLSDVTALREAGLARGGSMDNAIVVDGDRILNADGLRHDNEFVLHKALDAIGDMYLCGRPIIGRFTGICSSHADTARLMRQVLADRTAWDIVDMPAAPASVGWSAPIGLAAIA